MNNARSLMRSCARAVRCLRSLSTTTAVTVNQRSAFLGAVQQRMTLSTCNLLNASAKVRILKNPVRLTPTKAPLVLTPKAVARVKDLLSDRPGVIGLRIGVRTRGCSGLSYTLDYVAEKEDSKATSGSNGEGNEAARTLEKDIGRTVKQSHDVEVEQDGVRIFIDRRAQLTLLGTEMDFVETKLGAEFVFSNPNIKSTCGCGESFMLS